MQNYILITGASRGIGKAIALEFARNGSNIVIISKNNYDQLTETKNEAEAYGISCYAFLTDLSDYSSTYSLYDKLKTLEISISCLINNAGICYFGLLQDMSIEDWHRVIDTNLSSVFYTCKTFIPDMIHNKSGCIINISSVWGNVGASCEVAYSASKGGVNSFTKALAKELAPSDIKVNAIACGMIDTDMNAHLNADEIMELENEIPYGRMGKTEEVAKLAYSIYLNSNYLTGQIITLDGGWI